MIKMFLTHPALGADVHFSSNKHFLYFWHCHGCVKRRSKTKTQLYIFSSSLLGETGSIFMEKIYSICYNLLLLWMSTTRWCYNQGKCILAYNSHILYRIFKNLISTRSLNCVESHDIGHSHFRICLFLRIFVKCRNPFSNSSKAISLICTKLWTKHLWILLTKIYQKNFNIPNNTQVVK